MYEGYVSRSIVVWYLVMPHIKHVYVLLFFMMPYMRYAHLGLYIAVSLKGRTTHIWSFGCGFACATAIGCAGFRILFDTIIVL